MKTKLLLLLAIGLISCNSTKLFEEYKLFRKYKDIRYPSEKITIRLYRDDFTGELINQGKGREPFIQKFCFTNEHENFLVVKQVSQTSQSFISLNQGDTIISHERYIHFFNKGDNKYFLSFRRK